MKNIHLSSYAGSGFSVKTLEWCGILWRMNTTHIGKTICLFYIRGKKVSPTFNKYLSVRRLDFLFLVIFYLTLVYSLIDTFLIYIPSLFSNNLILSSLQHFPICLSFFCSIFLYLDATISLMPSFISWLIVPLL